MKKDDVTGNPAFATVFRHELGAIQDRRRSLRLEALEQAKQEGNYSEAAVELVFLAAREQERLAERASRVADHGGELLQSALDALEAAKRQDAAAVAAYARKAATAIQNLATDPRATMSVPTDFAKKRCVAPGKGHTAWPLAEAAFLGDRAGMPQLLELAKKTAAVLQLAAEQITVPQPQVEAPDGGQQADPTAGGQDRIAATARLIAATAWQSLQAALVSREPRQPAEGEPAILRVGHTERSRVAAVSAKNELDETEAVAKMIAAAHAANRAAEAAEKAAASVVLNASAAQDQISPSMAALRDTASAAKAAADSAQKTWNLPESNGGVLRLRQKTAEATITLAKAVLASTQVVSLADAASRNLVQGQIDEMTRAIVAGSEAAEECAKALEGPANARRAAALRAFSHSLVQVAETLGRVSAKTNTAAAEIRKARTALRGAVVKLRAALFDSDSTGKPKPSDLSHVWNELIETIRTAQDDCNMAAIAAHVVLDPAQQITNDEWKAASARKVEKAAARKLVAHAIKVTNSAWKAEDEAAAALRAASAMLAPKPPSGSSGWGGSGDSGGLAASKHGGSDGDREPSLQPVRLQALNMDLVGLAFSGGGIRSASFALGVLQALSRLRLLGVFDYLSTVSGGGYIGTWLAAWVQRERSLTNVERQLDPNRVEQAQAQRRVKQRENSPSTNNNHAFLLERVGLDEEPEPISHLRAYSRYLTPRPGLFAADTWTVGAIYLRNLLINLVCLLPWAMAVVLLSRLLVWGFTINSSEWVGGDLTGYVALAFLFCAGVLCVWLYQQRTRLREAVSNSQAHPDGADQLTAGLGQAVVGGIVVVAFASLVLVRRGWLVAPAGALSLGFWLLRRRAGTDTRSQTAATDLRTTLAGIGLIGTLLVFVAASLWLFGFEPPPGARRLTGAAAMQQSPTNELTPVGVSPTANGYKPQPGLLSGHVGWLEKPTRLPAPPASGRVRPSVTNSVCTLRGHPFDVRQSRLFRAFPRALGPLAASPTRIL